MLLFRPAEAFALGLFLLLSACSARYITLLSTPSGDRITRPGQPPRSSREDHLRLYGEYEREARLTLAPGMRVKVVAPILSPGQTLTVTARIADAPGPITATSNVTGFETAHYSALRWRFESAEAVTGGRRTTLAAPAAASLAVPPQSRHIELLFQRRLSHDDRSIALLADGQPVTVAPRVAVSAEIPVRVNGAVT
jgi:hypothetical protein